MTTLDNAFTDRNAEILARAAAPSPASLGEIWRSEWQASGLDTMTGVGKPWADAADELESTFRSVTGETVFEAASRRGIKLPGSSYEGRAEAVRQLSGDLDLSQRRAIEPLLDVRGRARAKASEIEKQAREIEDRTYGISGAAVGFLAGVARQSVDPVNLATLPLGAARGVGILRMLATEAGIGIATQAAQEPFIQAGRAELGLEAGLGQAVSNSLEAGLGAAGFAGLLRGAGFVARRAFGAPASAIEPAAVPVRADGADLAAAVGRAGDVPLPEVPAPYGLEVRTDGFDPALSRAMADIDPDDFHAVAHVVERDALVEGAAVLPTGEARMAHVERVDAAAGALETGRLDLLTDQIELEARTELLARRLDPDLYAQVDAIDAKRAGLRAELDRLLEERSAPPASRVLEPRIAELEAKLDAITGKRRSAPSTQALRDEIAALRADQARHADEAAGFGRDREQILRMGLTEAEMERARLGPSVRASQEAAAATPDLAFVAPARSAPAAAVADQVAAPRSEAAARAPAAATPPLPEAPVPPRAEPSPPGLPKAVDAAEAARRADLERMLAATDERHFVSVPGPDGKDLQLAPREAFARIEAEANAANELKACLGVAA